MESRTKLALKLWLGQMLLVWVCAFFNWHNFLQWDAMWYEHIVQFGYSATLNPDPTVAGAGNVGFFPGYLVIAMLLKSIAGLSAGASLVVVAQAMALIFWSLFIRWFEETDTPARDTNSKLFWFFCYPYTFFMMVAYTESTFLVGIMGFIYASEHWLRGYKKAWLAALICGVLMTATRMVGVVMVLYPLIRALQLKQEERVNGAITKAAALSILSLSGAIGFFIYCHFQFENWAFYFETEKKIWGTFVDWSKLFPPTELFQFNRPFRGDTTGKYVTLLLGGWMTWKGIQLLIQKQWRDRRFALILVCGMLWGEYLLGRTSWGYAGMGRYLMPIVALMLPYWKWNRRWILVSALALLILQIVYAAMFARHGWVA